MRNAGLDELQTGIGGRNIKNIRYADDTTLMAEREEELKNLLIRVEERERAGLKLNIKKKTKIVAASSPIISRQIEGEKVKVVTVSSSWALKSLRMVTAAMQSEDDCFSTGKWWQT